MKETAYEPEHRVEEARLAPSVQSFAIACVLKVGTQMRVLAEVSLEQLESVMRES